MSGPLIAVPGRFAARTSALRFGAVVTARALLDGVRRAGGEPLTVAPEPTGGDLDAVRARLRWADGVLLPGGGDLDPARYGQSVESDEVYDVDAVQDDFDLAVARWALAEGIPLFAVCRGLQVVDVALGGDLVQHMPGAHRHLVHPVVVTPGSRLASVLSSVPGGETVKASCYHHQCVGRVGEGLEVTAVADDGTPEAFELPARDGWFLGVQWHPEDTAADDPAQQALFDAFVVAAGRWAAMPRGTR